MSEAEIIQMARVVSITSDRAYLNLKRAIDLFICLLALFFLLPLMTLIAVVIMLDSPGPCFFVQRRIGKDGRPFSIFKFRTMVDKHDDRAEQKFMAEYIAGKLAIDSSSKDKAIFKSAKAADITRVGRFLRSSSLDELPQILNVLRGDMSLIGPRPNVTWEVEHYSKAQYQRLAVLPGITGLAQVRGRSNISFHEIVTHDIEYIHNISLKLDLQILWWTVQKLLDQKDAG